MSERAPLEPDARPRYPAGEQMWLGDGVEIVVARDERIGRDVALKRLTGSPVAGDVERFVHQAEVQGRLDHRAVVPVLDVGLDSNGSPYLVMRRVRGITLRTALARRVAGDRDAERLFTTRRLLSAFADICGAVAYAREHGVVHGALRPEHVLIGDFGEVYVIEWGNARPDDDHAADVRALGALLFGIVCLRPLAPGETDVHAAARAAGRHVAPELLDACASGLGGVARADDLAAAVRRWLDGVRDLRRRRELGVRHRERAGSALAAGDAVTAMREAGSALALDPADAAAAETLGRLMLTPPAPDSPEGAPAVEASDMAELRAQAKIAALSYLAVPAFLPLFMLCGIHHWGLFVAIFLLGGAEALLAVATMRGKVGRLWVPLSLLASAILMSLWARVFGPLLLVPSMVTVLAMTGMIVPGVRPWWAPAVGMIFPVLGIWGLEALGVLSPTTWFDGTSMVVTSEAISIPLPIAAIVLAAHACLTLTVASHFMWRLTRENREARTRLLMQAWHLEQIASVTRAA